MTEIKVITDYYEARERFEENYGRNVQKSAAAYEKAKGVLLDNRDRTGKIVLIVLVAIYALLIFFAGFIILFS